MYMYIYNTPRKYDISNEILRTYMYIKIHRLALSSNNILYIQIGPTPFYSAHNA